MALHCQVSVLYLFLPLNQSFQKKSLDVLRAHNLIDSLTETLKDMRTNCDLEFSIIFQNILKICNKLDIAVEIPRQTEQKTNRSNIPNLGPEDYNKKIIYTSQCSTIF
jgi:hypothetical protein